MSPTRADSEDEEDDKKEREKNECEDGDEPKNEVVDEEAEKKEKATKTKKGQEDSHEWERLTKNKPLLMRLAIKHYNVQGKLELRAPRFVPRSAPSDRFETKKKNNNLKLYVRRGCIMEDCEDLMPEWLNYVKGVVDPEDQTLCAIKTELVKKCLEMFAELAEKHHDYKKFYKQFGKCLKRGVPEDFTNRVNVAELMRYQTSKSGDEFISFKEDLDRKKEGQNDIFYITGETVVEVPWSPFIESLRKKGIEVMYMVDPIDEYAVQQLKEFHGKKLKSTTKEELDVHDGDEKNKKEELTAECEPLTDPMSSKSENVKALNLDVNALHLEESMNLSRWPETTELDTCVKDIDGIGSCSIPNVKPARCEAFGL